MFEAGHHERLETVARSAERIRRVITAQPLWAAARATPSCRP
jgi:hypothetical protein